MRKCCATMAKKTINDNMKIQLVQLLKTPIVNPVRAPDPQRARSLCLFSRLLLLKFVVSGREHERNLVGIQKWLSCSTPDFTRLRSNTAYMMHSEHLTDQTRETNRYARIRISLHGSTSLRVSPRAGLRVAKWRGEATSPEMYSSTRVERALI